MWDPFAAASSQPAPIANSASQRPNSLGTTCCLTAALSALGALLCCWDYALAGISAAPMLLLLLLPYPCWIYVTCTGFVCCTCLVSVLLLLRYPTAALGAFLLGAFPAAGSAAASWVCTCCLFFFFYCFSIWSRTFPRFMDWAYFFTVGFHGFNRHRSAACQRLAAAALLPAPYLAVLWNLIGCCACRSPPAVNICCTAAAAAAPPQRLTVLAAPVLACACTFSYVAVLSGCCCHCCWAGCTGCSAATVFILLLLYCFSFLLLLPGLLFCCCSAGFCCCCQITYFTCCPAASYITAAAWNMLLLLAGSMRCLGYHLACWVLTCWMDACLCLCCCLALGLDLGSAAAAVYLDAAGCLALAQHELLTCLPCTLTLAYAAAAAAPYCCCFNALLLRGALLLLAAALCCGLLLGSYLAAIYLLLLDGTAAFPAAGPYAVLCCCCGSLTLLLPAAAAGYVLPLRFLAHFYWSLGSLLPAACCCHRSALLDACHCLEFLH